MADTDFIDLPWDEIQQISEAGFFEEVFKKIPKARFQFAAKEENRDALIESALKTLRKNNADATYSQATLLVEIMQEYAKRILKG